MVDVLLGRGQYGLSVGYLVYDLVEVVLSPYRLVVEVLVEREDEEHVYP